MTVRGFEGRSKGPIKTNGSIQVKPAQESLGKEHGVLGPKPLGVICYKCRKTGHKFSECPLRKFNPHINLIEHEDANINEDEEEQVEDDHCEAEGADLEAEYGAYNETEGQSLVMHKLMINPKVLSDNICYRHSLFRTTCASSE